MVNRESRVFGVILITSTCFLSCKAQTIYGLGSSPEQRVSNNFYIKDLNNDYDAILGLWKSESISDSFEITLQKFEMNSYPASSTQYHDRVFGKYKYVQNGNVIAEVPNITSSPNAFLSFQFNSPTEYYVVIKDIVSNRAYSGLFILTSSTTATLELEPTKGIKVYNGTPPPDFALPTMVTFTKQ